jgi:hypothetical protein
MLPFDRKPWAKAVATAVICLSFVGAVGLAYFFYSTETLHIPEVVGILLLLLTIVPPNVAVVMRKPGDADPVNAHLAGDHFGHSGTTLR